MAEGQGTNRYADDREATIQPGANAHVSSRQQEGIGYQTRIQSTLPNPESLVGEMGNPASIEEEAQSPAVFMQKNLYSKTRPPNGQISQNYMAGQERVLTNSRGQSGQHQVGPKPQLRQNPAQRDQGKELNLNKKPS